jgi:hypothetical protein
MEYILFIHNNADSTVTNEQWASFINTAKQSGLFLGGSEISNQIQLGKKSVNRITDNIGGFMRFEADNEHVVLELLEEHPVFKQGGSLELCEMPKS